MEISYYTKKPSWSRNIYTKGSERRPTTVTDAFIKMAPMKLNMSKKILLDQTAFLQELSPMAHEIFSTNVRSLRPKYRYIESTGVHELKGYEDVERIGLPIQSSIRDNKTAYCFGNPLWFGNESGDENSEKMARFKTWWNSTNMTACLSQMGYHLFGTGDSAIAIYNDKDRIHYKVFGYENGDCVNEVYEYSEYGREAVGVRMFQIDGHDAVELYKRKVVELWVHASDDELKKSFGKTSGKKSADGYTLVYSTPHGFSRAPFVYFREKDVPWGVAQHICDKLDLLVSDLLESGRFFFNPYVFLKGGAIALPSTDFQGRVFASESESGDAKILEPPNASQMLETAFSKLMRMLLDSTKTVFIHHEDLKGQNDSGAYMRTLCFPEIQWATNFYPRINPQMEQLFLIFAEAIGLIEKDVTSYMGLRFSHQFTPCIPQNMYEEMQIITESYRAGVMSRDTSIEEHPLANPQERKRLEADDKRKADAEAVKTEAAMKVATEKNEETKHNEGKSSNNNNLKK